MATFYVGKDVKLSMTIEVEAETFEQALDKVECAWTNDETFIHNYLAYAASFDNDTYAGTPADYGMTLEDLCEK